MKRSSDPACHSGPQAQRLRKNEKEEPDTEDKAEDALKAKKNAKEEPRPEDKAEDAEEAHQLLTFKSFFPGFSREVKLFTALPLKDARNILEGGIDLVPSEIYWCSFIPCQTSPQKAFTAAREHWEKYHMKRWGKCPELVCCQLIDLTQDDFDVRRQAVGGYHVCFPPKTKKALPAKHLASVDIGGTNLSDIWYC